MTTTNPIRQAFQPKAEVAHQSELAFDVFTGISNATAYFHVHDPCQASSTRMATRTGVVVDQRTA